jgi:tetratricopeptide (TPR) repeat protein
VWATMASVVTSASAVGRGAALGVAHVASAAAAGEPVEVKEAPAGYVAIQRQELYRSSLESSTWQMLGSVSAAQYVGGFYPDVGIAGTSLSNVTSEPARRRPPAPLGVAQAGQDAKRPPSGAALLKSQSDAGKQAPANPRSGPRLAKSAAEANALGTAAVARGEHTLALQLFDEGLASNPEPVLKNVLLTNRSSTLSQAMRFRDALRDAEASISLDPTWTRGYQVRGAALMGLGRREEGMACLEKAVELDPTDEEARVNLQMEKANIPANVRLYLSKTSSMGLSKTSIGIPNEMQPYASSKAVSVISAMENRGDGMRRIIIESITVENLPGDIFGLCKPFLRVQVGDAELKTKVLTTRAGDDLAGNLEKIGFEPGVPCSRTATWSGPMVFEFDKGATLYLTVRVMEAERIGWDEETGAATVALLNFSHGIKDFECTLFKDGQPVKGQGGLKDTRMRIMARVPAVLEDGPVGIGVCFLMRGRDLFIDSLTSNYSCRDGVDPRHGDKVVSIDGADVQGLALSHVVTLTMGPLGSSCRLELERIGTRERVEALLERCALDVPEIDHLKADAFTDDEQIDFLAPLQVTPQTSLCSFPSYISIMVHRIHPSFVAGVHLLSGNNVIRSAANAAGRRTGAHVAIWPAFGGHEGSAHRTSDHDASSAQRCLASRSD